MKGMNGTYGGEADEGGDVADVEEAVLDDVGQELGEVLALDVDVVGRQVVVHGDRVLPVLALLEHGLDHLHGEVVVERVVVDRGAKVGRLLGLDPQHEQHLAQGVGLFDGERLALAVGHLLRNECRTC